MSSILLLELCNEMYTCRARSESELHRLKRSTHIFTAIAVRSAMLPRLLSKMRDMPLFLANSHLCALLRVAVSQFSLLVTFYQLLHSNVSFVGKVKVYPITAKMTTT